jgi:cell division protein FtsL
MLELIILVLIIALIFTCLFWYCKYRNMQDNINYLNNKIKQEERLNARRRAGYTEYPLA